MNTRDQAALLAEIERLAARLAEVIPQQSPVTIDLHTIVRAVEVSAIRSAVQANRGNQSAAARALGINRLTLRRKLAEAKAREEAVRLEADNQEQGAE